MHVTERPTDSRRVRQIELPPAAGKLSTLERIDYADAFLLEIDERLERTPLEWAREILEAAPRSFRTGAPRVWRVLGLKHRPQGRASVLGWPIRHDSPEFALLGATSRTGMPAELLVWRPAPGQLLFATLVQHGNRAVAALWAAITPAHQRIVRELLERASDRAAAPAPRIPAA